MFCCALPLASQFRAPRTIGYQRLGAQTANDACLMS